jgi:hypothetical protein
MTDLSSYNPLVEDPLIARLDLDKPVNADCLRAAIKYNEIHIEIRKKNIEALSRALSRLLGTPPASPSLQESARRAGVGVE